MKVTVFSTKGAKKSVINSSAKTWGELRKDLAEAGIPYSGMRAILGETKVTLESSAAVLPVDFDFTLFLSPVKVKSGVDINSMSRSDLYSFIKEQRTIDNSGAVELFGNYPSKSTDELKKLVKSYLDKNAVNTEVVNDTKERVLQAIETIKMNLEKIKDYIVNNKINVPEGITVEELQIKFNEIEMTL